MLGEGAGFLVLEEWASARGRGARIYAELAGDGNSLSSYRITDSHPSGDGPIQAMRQALADAGAAVTYARRTSDTLRALGFPNGIVSGLGSKVGLTTQGPVRITTFASAGDDESCRPVG